MRTLIVDDELLARKRLRRMLEMLPGVEVVGEAEHGKAALKQTEALTPDLVFMDIQMPGMNGLDAAAQLARREPAPALIFCTAFDEHALAAFDSAAIDYLLKPVEGDQLRKAVERAARLNQAQLSALTEQASPSLLVSTSHGVEKLPIQEIFYLRADQKYVVAVHRGGEALLRDSLQQLEQAWPEHFVRAHRNTLIARHCLRGIDRDGKGQRAVLEGLREGPAISRRHLSEVKNALYQRQ